MVAPRSSVDIRKSKSILLSTWHQAVLLPLITTVAYFQTWVDIWPYWVGDIGLYTHGTLVALAALWLLLRARSVVDATEPKASARAVPVVLLLSAIWVLAESANVFILYVTLWPILAFTALWTGLGLQVALRLATPLGFLYFAFPIWDLLQPPLQTLASAMVGLLTDLIGLPATLDGNYLTLPTGRIFIAEDCSGAHFLCIGLAVGVLAGIVRGDVPRTRILILLIAGSFSLAFNWLRILLIAFANLHPDLTVAMDRIGGHVVFGWLVFAISLLSIGLVLRFVPRATDRPLEEQSPARRPPRRLSEIAGVRNSALALTVLPVFTWALPRFDSHPEDMPGIGADLSGTQASLIAPDLRWSPHFPGATWEGRSALLLNDGLVVEVYGNRFIEQTQGSELISSVSHLFDASLFTSDSSLIVKAIDANGQSISARREILTDSSGNRWLTLYTYLVDNDSFINTRRVQLSTALRSTYSRPTAGVIAVATACADSCESGLSDLESVFIALFEKYRDETG